MQKLTEAQIMALTYFAGYAKDGKLVIKVPYSNGPKKQTLRKLKEFGFAETRNYSEWLITPEGEKAADELVRAGKHIGLSTFKFDSLRELLAYRAKLNAEGAEKRAKLAAAQVALAQACAEKVPPGIGENFTRTSDLRSELTVGIEFDKPITKVSLSMVDFAKLLGVEVPEGVE